MKALAAERIEAASGKPRVSGSQHIAFPRLPAKVTGPIYLHSYDGARTDRPVSFASY